MRLKNILMLTTLLLGVFFLFSPQTSQAISCKCSMDIPLLSGGINIGCTTLSNNLNSSPYSTSCDQLKQGLIANDPAIVTEMVQGFSDNIKDKIYDPSTQKFKASLLSDQNLSCEPCNPLAALESLQADLNARKPVLEINIPNLNFSDVSRATDESGTYVYIAWIPEFISALYKFGLAIVSIVAAVVIVLQGVRVIASGGGEAKSEAYKKILQSVIGLFIAWGSYAILYNINPALVQFNALKVRVVPEVALIPDNIKTDDAVATPGDFKPVGNCSDPNFTITDATKFDQSLNQVAITAVKNALRKYPQMIGIYKTAQQQTGVPWEMLAAMHYGEGGMNSKLSIFNGNSKMCNTNDDPDAKNVCNCNPQTATIQDDITCGAQLIQSRLSSPKLGGAKLDATNPNIQQIKLGLCSWNGCAYATKCPESSSYVAARFDQTHMGYPPKSAHDCVSPKCKDGCTDDVTHPPGRTLHNCCQIRTLKNVPEPNPFNGSSCANNRVTGKCCVDEGSTYLCTYTPTLYSRSNPCGAQIFKDQLPERPGALVIYGIIKYLESSGQI